MLRNDKQHTSSEWKKGIDVAAKCAEIRHWKHRVLVSGSRQLNDEQKNERLIFG